MKATRRETKIKSKWRRVLWELIPYASVKMLALQDIFQVSLQTSKKWLDITVGSLTRSKLSLISSKTNSPDFMERQRPRGLHSTGPHCGDNLEPGGEMGSVRGQEGGQGVAIVRSDQ